MLGDSLAKLAREGLSEEKIIHLGPKGWVEPSHAQCGRNWQSEHTTKERVKEFGCFQEVRKPAWLELGTEVVG